MSITEERKTAVVGKALIQELRPHQWLKNLLVFVPLFLSFEFDFQKVICATIAFVSFCLCASGVYVVNDLGDLFEDRLHPVKRKRPFASGALPIAWGVWLAAALFGSGMVLSLAALPWRFTAVLTLYVVMSSLYSLWFKRTVMLDVVILAGLYTVRIVAGGLGAGVEVSSWELGLSMFFFTSLAFGKRYAELSRLAEEGDINAAGRGYLVTDLSLIETLGPAAGYIAVLVLALYIDSDAMKRRYLHHWALWLICPLALYWVGRFWFIAKRRQLNEDPLVFTLTDHVSLLVGLIAVALVLLARYLPAMAG